MPQIIVCEWRIIFSENLLHKNVYPVKDPWSMVVISYVDVKNIDLENRISISATQNWYLQLFGKCLYINMECSFQNYFEMSRFS